MIYAAVFRVVIGVYSAVEVDNIYPLIFHHLWCEISPCLDAVITTEKHFDLLTSSYRFRQQEQFCCLFLWVTVPLTSRMWIVIIFKKERDSNEIRKREKGVVCRCKAENTGGF